MNRVSGICLSAQSDEDISYITSLINSINPKIEIVDFKDVLENLALLENCDFLFPIGGDGSIAWVVGEFFKKYGEQKLNKLKPIVPVVRPKSVGYLKQLDFDAKKFNTGFKKLEKNRYSILNRIVLKTTINKKKYLAVNEINFSCYPQLGKITVYLKNQKKYHPVTTTYSDGVFISTPTGSSGWSLSYGGQIMLDEDSIEIVFAGGTHASGNFILPRRSVKVELVAKNTPINSSTIQAFEEGVKRHELKKENNPSDLLKMIYSPRIIIDGKLISFDIKEITIDPSLSIPMVFLSRETTIDKARKLTKLRSVK